MINLKNVNNNVNGIKHYALGKNYYYIICLFHHLFS